MEIGNRTVAKHFAGIGQMRLEMEQDGWTTAWADDIKKMGGSMALRTYHNVLTNSKNRAIFLSIIPLSSFGERAQDRLVRGGPCLFLSGA